MTTLAQTPLAIFIDLTGDGAGTGARGQVGWPHADRFTARACRVTCVVRPGTWTHLPPAATGLGWRVVVSDSAVDACSDAMARAAADRAWLLLLQGPVEAVDEAVYAMRDSVLRDPMFMAAAARIRCARGCCVKGRSRHGLEGADWIPRRTLASTTEVEIGPELFESSLLVNAQILAEFGTLDAQFSTLGPAVVHHLSKARRCGYRVAVANRAVMGVCGLSCETSHRASAAVPENDWTRLRHLVSGLERGWNEFRAGSSARFETLSATSVRAANGRARPSLLLDIRNVVAVHNGTTQAVLGSVQALRHASPRWDIEVLANPVAVEFHRLMDLCRGWKVHTTVPPPRFAAALRLSQPWHIQEMIDLHHTAFFNVYFMLDTISWDIVYTAPPHLDGVWSFLADHADGFLFDSAFTERRFLGRFDRARGVPCTVCHYPFDPTEYVRPDARREAQADYIFVVGNELDHKDVTKTVHLLAAAFPFQPLVAFGPGGGGAPWLREIRSGTLSDAEVHRVYAGARLIVFPSFYEGFGFPVVTALAYGKTLIARWSELLEETAGRCPASTGRLLTFSRRDELVELVGRVLHGEPVPEAPVRTALAGKPRTWQHVASDIINFMDRIVREPERSRWPARERIITQFLAAQA